MNRYTAIIADPTADDNSNIQIIVQCAKQDDIEAAIKAGHFSAPKALPAGFTPVIKNFTRIVRPKVLSRNQRMADAVSAARDAMAKLHDALEAVNSVRDEYESQYDQMPEGWQQGEKGQQVEAIKDTDCDADSLLSEVESSLNTIEENLS